MSTVNLENKTILVTGAAGFIGSNLVKRIYEEVPSATVIGIDNMNAYYDVALKEFRLNELAKYPTFTFVKGNIADMWHPPGSGFLRSLKPAVILMMTDKQEWSIWYMLLLPVFMVQTKRFRTAQMIRWITRFPSMQPLRNLTN